MRPSGFFISALAFSTALAGCVPPGESPLSQPELGGATTTPTGTSVATPAPTTPAAATGVVQLTQTRPGSAAAQRALARVDADYREAAGNRAITGAVAGLLICQIADCPRGTTVQAVAQGAIIGAGDAGYLAGRSASFRPTPTTLADDLQQAERETARMLSAVAAAEAALAYQQQESARLGAGFSAGSVTAGAYATAVQTFGYDAQIVQSLITTINVRVTRLQLSANDHRPVGPTSALLFDQLRQQQNALARLQRTHSAMLSVIGDAPAGIVQ